MMRTVVAGLLWQQGCVLACQRRHDARLGGKWEFPGGKVEPGESSQAALRRELEEELGVNAIIGEMIWETEHQYPGFDPVKLLFFSVEGFSGEVDNLAFEQIRWVRPVELPALDFLEADLPLVRKLASTNAAAER